MNKTRPLTRNWFNLGDLLLSNLKKSSLEEKETMFSTAALPKAAGAQQLSQQKQQSHALRKGCSGHMVLV